MKNSFSLLEVIFTCLIAALIFVLSISYLKDLVSFNNSSFKKELRNLDLLSTKIFLQKNNSALKDKLIVEDETGILYYNGRVLLNDVISIDINLNDQSPHKEFYEIKLVLKNQTINWIIKHE